ncbi:MAG: 50S ribosomal protein L21 [Myxococcota bacterium]
MYAVIRTGGKQYKVSEGDVIRVESLGAEEGKEVIFEEVLLVSGEDKMFKGTPLVENAKVSGKVLKTGRGEKVIVFHRLRRKGFHKKQGHRQEFTEVKIEKIKI